MLRFRASDMKDFFFINLPKGGLKIHTGRKHKEFPQLDGDMQTERQTDDWWENKPVAEAADADPSQCNFTNRQNPPLQ